MLFGEEFAEAHAAAEADQAHDEDLFVGEIV